MDVTLYIFVSKGWKINSYFYCGFSYILGSYLKKVKRLFLKKITIKKINLMSWTVSMYCLFILNEIELFKTNLTIINPNSDNIDYLLCVMKMKRRCLSRNVFWGHQSERFLLVRGSHGPGMHTPWLDGPVSCPLFRVISLPLIWARNASFSASKLLLSAFWRHSIAVWYSMPCNKGKWKIKWREV